MDTNKHSIGKTIADLRNAKGWTQAELAEKLHVSDKAISKWENGTGTPSVEFFPLLAEVFAVTIDYIMTGRVSEKEALFISKAEYCAKRDDITLIDSINVNHKDEYGKTFVDYITEYQSLKVFVAYCEKDKRNINGFNISTAIKFCIITNRLNLLKGAVFNVAKNWTFTFRDEYELFSLFVKDEEKYYENKSERLLCVISDDILDTIVCDERVNEATLSFILGKQKNRHYGWYNVFPWLIHRAYVNRKTQMLERLVAISVESNNYGLDIYNEPTNFSVRNNRRYSHYYCENISHGFVRILEKTFKVALERGDLATITKLSKINSDLNTRFYLKEYLPSEDELRISRLRHDKSVSREELAVQSAIHCGIIYVDELLKVKDINVIKKALEDYPIHTVERLLGLYRKKQWQELGQLAKSMRNNVLYNAINDKKYNIVETEICKYAKTETDDLKANRKYLNIIRYNGNSGRIREQFVTLRQMENATEIEGFIKECKIRIIDDLSLAIVKDATLKVLTREFFLEELAKNNTEIVVIKLCVRMECVLKSTYHYEGDFSDMVTRYCNEKLCWKEDDGWGNYNDVRDGKSINLLHKLRKQRNSIVHAENDSEPMSISEIKACIDLICAIN